MRLGLHASGSGIHTAARQRVELLSVTHAPPVSRPSLRISDLHVSYARVRAVSGITLSAFPGRVLALLGPNGAGKSTTIAAAVGLVRPTQGDVRVFGMDPVSDHVLTAGLTGVMLQEGGLPMASKPLEILTHLSKLYAHPVDVKELAERLGITGFAGRTVRRLSGGQRQRVALAAALVGRPRLVFLDEPTAGLDPQAALVVDEIISELRSDGVAVVLTTHDMRDAQKLADDVLIVDHGRVVVHGTVDELISGTAEQNVSTLHITLISPPHSALLDALAAIGPLDADGPTVRVHADFTPRTLAAATAVLADFDAAVSAFSLSERTLGDVFLDLTGRDLR